MSVVAQATHAAAAFAAVSVAGFGYVSVFCGERVPVFARRLIGQDPTGALQAPLEFHIKVVGRLRAEE
jgi:hypothetical protein